MKKYTLIYGSPIGRGTMHVMRIGLDRVETEDIAALLKNEKYNGNVYYVFEGHPKMEGEN